MNHADEMTLPGGTANRGRVVRVGRTIRRPLRPTSPATEALLGHLAAAGFDGAPRWLGVDEQGRETLTYMVGQTPIAPYPDWALAEEALASVARLLYRFHAAVEGFAAQRWTWHREVPLPFRTGLASHNDPNLDNVVFRDRQAVALIDFDLAGAGSKVWDLAAAARLWCPLRDESDVLDLRQGRSMERLRLFLDAYGADRREREQLPEAVMASHHWSYDHVRHEVAQGHPAFTEHWVERRARERADRTLAWLRARRDDIARAARGQR